MKEYRMMKRYTQLAVSCMAVLGLMSVPLLAETDGGPVEAGFSQLSINPEVGYPHYRKFGTGITDPLFVKAAVFKQGKTAWAIAACDLLWIERDLSAQVRVEVASQTGIPFEHILITATHTHTGPAYHSNILELNEHVRETELTADEATAMHGYPDFLRDQVIAALLAADERAEPVTIRSATEKVEDLSFNRRFLMKDGKVITNPGKGNPSIVRAVGPIDPDLEVLFVESVKDGKLLSIISNFAVHTDTKGGTNFSADYPGVLGAAVAETWGEEVVSLFLQGASGDLNHVDVRKDSARLSTEAIGKGLANKVQQASEKLQPIAQPRLGVGTEVVYAPLQAYNDAERAWAHSEVPAPKYGEKGHFELRRPMKIRSLARIRASEAVPPTIETEAWTLPLEVQAFRVSDEVAVVGLPGEVFVELGLAVKAASPFKTTLVVELTHVHIAYLPTKRAFAEGGYETLNSRLQPGGGEALVEAAVRQLHALKQP